MKKVNVVILLFTVFLGIANVPAQTNFGPLTEPFFRMISDRNVHIRSANYEVYIKDDKTLQVFWDNGSTSRIIVNDNKLYFINDSAKSIYIVPAESNDIIIELTANALIFSGSGNSIFAGQNLPYEEYKTDDGHTIQYFVKGNRLAGFRTMTPKNVITDTVILEINQRIPERVFNIPKRGYKVTDRTK